MPWPALQPAGQARTRWPYRTEQRRNINRTERRAQTPPQSSLIHSDFCIGLQAAILPLHFPGEPAMSFSLQGRVAVVFGVANKRSIAWSIAQGLHDAGAKLVITYQNERLALEAK